MVYWWLTYCDMGFVIKIHNTIFMFPTKPVSSEREIYVLPKAIEKCFFLQTWWFRLPTTVLVSGHMYLLTLLHIFNYRILSLPNGQVNSNCWLVYNVWIQVFYMYFFIKIIHGWRTSYTRINRIKSHVDWCYLMNMIRFDWLDLFIV